MNMTNNFYLHQKDTLNRMVDLGDSWRIDYQVQHGAILTRRQDAELTMGMFMNVIREVMGPHYSPAQFTLSILDLNSGKNIANYLTRLFILINHLTPSSFQKDVQHTMPGRDSILLTVILDTLHLLNRASPSQCLADQVRSHQLELSEGEPNLEKIAHDIGLTSCTLTRLKMKGSPLPI